MCVFVSSIAFVPELFVRCLVEGIFAKNMHSSLLSYFIKALFLGIENE